MQSLKEQTGWSSNYSWLYWCPTAQHYCALENKFVFTQKKIIFKLIFSKLILIVQHFSLFQRVFLKTLSSIPSRYFFKKTPFLLSAIYCTDLASMFLLSFFMLLLKFNISKQLSK